MHGKTEQGKSLYSESKIGFLVDSKEPQKKGLMDGFVSVARNSLEISPLTRKQILPLLCAVSAFAIVAFPEEIGSRAGNLTNNFEKIAKRVQGGFEEKRLTLKTAAQPVTEPVLTLRK